MPALAAFARATPGVAVIGIATRDRRRKAADFARARGVAYILALDSAGAVADRYGVVGLPTTVLIDSQGRIARTIAGPVARAELASLTKGL
jgi:peroxiredoxin